VDGILSTLGKICNLPKMVVAFRCVLHLRASRSKNQPRSTEATNLNPIAAVIPFAAQALQRWQ